MCCGVVPILFGWFLRFHPYMHLIVFIRKTFLWLVVYLHFSDGLVIIKCICFCPLTCILPPLSLFFFFLPSTVPLLSSLPSNLPPSPPLPPLPLYLNYFLGALFTSFLQLFISLDCIPGSSWRCHRTCRTLLFLPSYSSLVPRPHPKNREKGLVITCQNSCMCCVSSFRLE